jgi:hypothetical protein
VTDDLDAALAGTEPAVETARSVVSGKARVCKHRWQTIKDVGRDMTWAECIRCGIVRDPVRSRRGKSSRRLGHDQERRAERVYGWEKIGERGEKTDLRGRMFKVQQKASRRPPPALIRDTFAGLEATRDGRIPALLLSFIRPGVPTEDYILIRGADWLDLHGRDEETP